jgi:meiotic recombination protein SPO11
MECHSAAASQSSEALSLVASASRTSGRSEGSVGVNVAVLPQRQTQMNQAGAVISKIETIFESLIDGLADGACTLSIPYRSRTTTARSRAQDDNGQLLAGARHEEMLSFPGRTAHEARKFGRHIIAMCSVSDCCCFSLISLALSLKLLCCVYLRYPVKPSPTAR